MLSYETKPED
jgi:hypothetical protein